MNIRKLFAGIQAMPATRTSKHSVLHTRYGRPNQRTGLFIVWFATFVAILVLVSPVAVKSKDTVPRDILENMARSQYDVLCGSEVFVACMGFSEMACQDLANTAIEQCLLPLPEEINPEQLDNGAIESCPRLVFEDAGFSDEKAARCFDEAIKAE